MRFPMIERLGLETSYRIRSSDGDLMLSYECVKCEDLEKLLSEAKVVYGNGRQMDVVSWATNADTHEGLLIGLRELKPKIIELTRAELKEKLKPILNEIHVDEIADRLGL